MSDREQTPEDAFGVLSHDVRLSVLKALAARQQSGTFAAEPLSFSALAEAVGVRDSGNFTYHLDVLREGGFITRAADGYRISQAGTRIIRAIRAGTITDDTSFKDVPVGEPCPYCDGQSTITLADDWLIIRCLDCHGAFAQDDDLPDGTLAAFSVTPAAVNDRSPPDIFRMAYRLGLQLHRQFAAGVCPDCGGTTTVESLEFCADHAVDSSGLCEDCGRTLDEFVTTSCDVCGRSLMTFPSIIVATDETVLAAMYERGRDRTDRTWTPLSKPPNWPCECVQTDPTILEYTIPVPDGGPLCVQIDQELTVTVLNP